jgi:hypothetical protein
MTTDNRNSVTKSQIIEEVYGKLGGYSQARGC